MKTTSLDLDIRSRVGEVLSGDAALRDFYYWFVPATWDVEHTKNPEAIRLTHAIAHLFAELSDGDLTSEEFLHELAGTISEQ